MQLQAEVCDVDAVEYFEIAFASVPTLTEDVISKTHLPYVGKLCVIANEKGEPETYAYSPVFPATKKGISDANKWIPTGLALETCCWYVKDSHHSTVLRNKQWWLHVGLPSYKKLWEEIDEARASGKYKRQALFIDDKTTVASDRSSVDDEDAKGANTNAATGVFLGIDSETE